MSLFVEDNDAYSGDETANEVPAPPNEAPGLGEGFPALSEEPLVFPVRVQDPPHITPVFEAKDVSCSLLLLFHQEIVDTMLSKDGLLVLGRGLGWEVVTANLLYALSSPKVSLVTGGRKIREGKRSLVLLLNSRDDEAVKLRDELMDLVWMNASADGATDVDLEKSPLTIIGSETTTADRRRRIYDEGGIVSVTSRVLVVDFLSGILSPNDVTGLFVLHAERVRETSNESFIVHLYRDSNDWGFVKAVSDEPEAFTGFTPLASKLKVLRITNVFLWPRFHVDVSTSLMTSGKSLSQKQKKEIEKLRFVTEINTKLSYKMNKIQAAILACLNSCLQELKRHNPTLASEYWDMENIHDLDFVLRVRLSMDSQWHRLSWTSKQLMNDLSTLKDLLANLLNLDSLSFYQIVQGIVDLNTRSTTNSVGLTNTTIMSPWLNLDEADTIISYSRDRALAKMKIYHNPNHAIDVETGEQLEIPTADDHYDEEYLLEELPKWDQLGLLLDDIMHEKSVSSRKSDGPVLIMCSSSKIVKQLAELIAGMAKQENTATGKKRYSSRNYMVSKLNDYLSWQEVSSLTKRLNVDLAKTEDDKVGQIDTPDHNADEELNTSKTFSRGKGVPVSKRRRTRGASSVASVAQLRSGSAQGRSTEAVDIDAAILKKLQDDIVQGQEGELDDEFREGELFVPADDKDFEEEAGGFLQDHNGLLALASFQIEHLDRLDQIIIETYNDRTNESLLQELSPSYIVMYEPDLSFIRRVEVFQAVNRESPAKTYFMYYGTSVEEQTHLLRIKKEKEAFTRLIKEKATLSKHFETELDNYKFTLRKQQVVNTRIAGGLDFRTETDEMRVIVDVREFRSPLPNLLYKVGIKVIPCMLTVGDYIVSPKICIERKAIPDLIASFKSGRLYTQCEQMFRHYETPVLLIEFDESKSFSFEPFAELRNFKQTSLSSPPSLGTKLLRQDIQTKLVMLLVSFPKLKIIWSSSPYETAQIYLELKANQDEPDIEASISKGVNPQIKTSGGEPPMYNDDAIDIIQSIPGINNVNYHIVIQRVRCIEALVKLTKDELTDMLGIENGTKAHNFINHRVR